MQPAERLQLWTAGHFTVIAHDLADDGGGFQAGEVGEIDTAFGLSGADEHATLAGAEGVDVARP